MKKSYLSANAQLFLYFGILALIGSITLQIPFLYKDGKAISYLDSLFVAVSALCVTGLSTVDISLFNNKGLFAIMLIIEAGGLGLISFFTLYLALPRAKISQINRKFVREFFLSDVEINPRKIVLRILSYTLTIQFICAICLAILLHNRGEKYCIFYGIFFAISAFCNAGFSPYSDSLISFNQNIPFCLIISILIITGGLGFTVMQDIAQKIYATIKHKKHKHLSLHSKIVLAMTIILVIIPTILIFIVEYNKAFQNLPVKAKLLNAFFQSVTTRTAGFECISQKAFSEPSALISCILMIIGGNPGSMAGGIKTTTVLLLLCSTFRDEDDKNNMSIFKRDISDSTIAKASSITIKALLFLVTVLFLLFISESKNFALNRFDTDDLLYEALSAIATVGLTRSVTPYLMPFSKILIIVTMFAGRTGIIAMSMRIKTKQQNMNRFIDYPTENIIVG